MNKPNNFPRRNEVGETDLMYWDLVAPLNPYHDKVKGGVNALDKNKESTAEFLDTVKSIKLLGLDGAKQLLTKVKAARTFYYDLEQNKKLDSNGLYGYVGASFAEYTSMEVAADITAEGRWIFKTLDVETTRLLDNVEVPYKGGKIGLLDLYIDFKEMKERFGDIVRVDTSPKSIPHLVESQEVIEHKPRGNRGNPKVEFIDKTPTRHTVLYGDTDSICIGFENICRSYGIDPETDDILRICRFIEWFCLEGLIPFYHKIIQNMCDMRNATNFYVLECEQILEKMHIYAKKCYCSSLIILDGTDKSDEEDVKAGGIVVKKTSYPKIIRKKLKDLLNIMLRSSNSEHNNLPYLLDMMSKHIQELNKLGVEELSNTQTVRKFSNKTEMVNGRYVTTKGAGVNEKGITTYNNIIIDQKINERHLGNGSKVKSYPFIVGKEIQYFSWDIDDSELPPTWAPKPSMDILIYKKYSKSAILYITTEYPHLKGKEMYLVEPWNFPKAYMKA